jgi:hypothetical protein
LPSSFPSLKRIPLLYATFPLYVTSGSWDVEVGSSFEEHDAIENDTTTAAPATKSFTSFEKLVFILLNF